MRVNSPVTTVMMPVVLAVIMYGLGLGLTLADFRRVRHHPRAVAAALVCQVLLLPAACFGLVLAFDLAPAYAVGMMLLAASPGGAVANYYSRLFGGDVALNITLTAVNSALSLFSLPLIVNFSLDHFDIGRDDLGLNYDKILQVFAIVLIPVGLGMLTRARAPRVKERIDRPVRAASLFGLFLVIVGVAWAERDRITDSFVDLGPITFLFTLVSLAVGYGATRLVRAAHPQAVACCFEIGMHNVGLAMTIAISPTLLDSTAMAMPGAVYAVLSYVAATAAGYTLRAISPEAAARRRGPAPAPSGGPTARG